MKVFLCVRAHVSDGADRAAFDEWYQTHHLPLARSVFRAEHAIRMWDTNDPSRHTAMYRFSNLSHLEERIASKDFPKLLADFDAAWPHVTRTREVLQVVQELDN